MILLVKMIGTWGQIPTSILSCCVLLIAFNSPLRAQSLSDQLKSNEPRKPLRKPKEAEPNETSPKPIFNPIKKPAASTTAPQKTIDFKPLQPQTPPPPHEEKAATPTPEKERISSRYRPIPVERQANMKGFITSRLLRITKEPRPSADMVVQLKRGDSIIVTPKNSGNYVSVQYWIDGEFPVEGWAPISAMQVINDPKELAGIRKDLVQGYEPQPKQKILTDENLKEVPEVNTEEEKRPFQDKTGSPIPPPPRDQGETAELEFFEVLEAPILRKDKKLSIQLQVESGLNFFGESIKTKNTGETQEYFADPFLDYEMNGYEVKTLVKALYALDYLEVGGQVQYGITIFNGSVPATNANIANSSVLGTLHDISLAPVVRKNFPFKLFSLEPELQVGIHYQLFSVNQLRAESNNQPVLFNWKNLHMKLRFIPRFYIPYGLSLEPLVGFVVFQSISESPLQNVDNAGNALPETSQIRTGSAGFAPGGLIYGASLIWDLRAANVDQLRIRLSYEVEDHSRKFSGFGNRAGIATLDAKSSVQFTHYLLGLDYFF